jgi:transcriptional regulator with XRE-family HTH domain
MKTTKQERLRLARERKGLSRKEVAEMVGCSSHTIRHWESDTEPGSTKQAIKLCEVVGIDYMFYMTGDVYTKLTDKEAMIISWYRAAPRSKQLALELLTDRRDEWVFKKGD